MSFYSQVDVLVFPEAKKVVRVYKSNAVVGRRVGCRANAMQDIGPVLLYLDRFAFTLPGLAGLFQKKGVAS